MKEPVNMYQNIIKNKFNEKNKVMLRNGCTFFLLPELTPLIHLNLDVKIGITF